MENLTKSSTFFFFSFSFDTQKKAKQANEREFKYQVIIKDNVWLFVSIVRIEMFSISRKHNAVSIFFFFLLFMIYSKSCVIWCDDM